MDTEDMLTAYKLYLKKTDNEGFYITEQDFGSVMNARELMDFYKTRNRLDNIEIDRVIFNYPATIVWFADGTKVVARCGHDDVWDYEKGIMTCMLKKLVGNKYLDTIKIHTPPRVSQKALDALQDELDKMCEGLTLNDDGKVVPE